MAKSRKNLNIPPDIITGQGEGPESLRDFIRSTVKENGSILIILESFLKKNPRIASCATESGLSFVVISNLELVSLLPPAVKSSLKEDGQAIVASPKLGKELKKRGLINGSKLYNETNLNLH